MPPKTTSYQRRVAERDHAKAESEKLKQQLHAKANIFWAEHRFLGVGKLAMGTVIDHQMVQLWQSDIPAKEMNGD